MGVINLIFQSETVDCVGWWHKSNRNKPISLAQIEPKNPLPKLAQFEPKRMAQFDRNGWHKSNRYIHRMSFGQ